MLVMGIDTSSEIGAVGLINEQGVQGEINIRHVHRHSERLLPNIDFLFEETGFEIKDLDGIAVTIGPGSFTGLRIGLSSVKALIQVLDIPVVGLSTLDILAYNFFQHRGWLVPVIDARRERVYTSLYQGRQQDIRHAKNWPDQALKVSELLERLIPFSDQGELYLVGDGVDIYRDKFIKSNLDLILAPVEINFSRGGLVAGLGRFYLKQGVEDNIYQLLPNYLKKPQAEINWLKKHRGQVDGGSN